MTDTPRICANCQTPLPDEALFCLKCGTPTPTEPGVPARTMPTGAVEVHKVRQALEGRYRIERVLGEGGMATVYLAEDLKHHRQVAIKVMRPELAQTLGAERFLREVEIAAKLNHQNILPVFDSGATDGVLYYVMPVVEGESLPARIAREGELPAAEALRIAREVAEALAHAHKRGIIHRDIKPANILINEGHALVSDFGIARATDDAAALTKTGLAIGTPAYMSPEQSSGEQNIDGRTDVYALGCVLYEMLTGEPPFTGRTAQAIIARSLTEDPRPVTATRAALAPVVNTVVLKALAKQRSDRYADAGEFAAALANAEDVTRSGAFTRQATGDTRQAKMLRPWMLAVGAVVILAVGALSMKLLGGGSGGATSLASSVAVLPFENQGSADDAYFADGIVDELRDRLTRLGKFTVIASASADQFKGSTKQPTEIAKELHVDQVLTGKVRWATDAKGTKQFRVTTELVNGQTGNVTWRDSFDGDLTDPFAVQGQIATRVAGALGAVLADSQTQDLAGRPTDNAEAYNLYLKARAIPGLTAQGGRERANLLEQAVALDSNFVQAWSWLSVSMAAVYGAGAREPAAARRAKEALDKALQLAPDSAGPHMVAANYYNNVTRDQAAARRETERALQIDPRNLYALRSSAAYDLQDGNYQAVFEKLSRAREIDPLDKNTLSLLMRVQLNIGQYQEALKTSQELVALKPTDYGQIQGIALVYVANGDLPGAKRIVQEFLREVPATELTTFFAGYQETAFLLGPEQLDLLFRMTPTAFDNDRAWWGQALAIAAMQQGDMTRARAYADSSLATAQQQIDATPNDPQLRVLNAVMLAFAGRKADAVREADRAMADTVGLSPTTISYDIHQYVRAMLAAGEKERALDALEALMRRQYFVTPGFLKTAPMFRPLDGNPRFERLANRGIGAENN